MVLSLNRWVDKVAVVTGASSGIGAAIAEELVKAGVVVAGLARRKERLEKLTKKLSGEKGKLVAIQADITKEEDIKAAFAYVLKNLGPVSILVNNAGLSKYTSLTDGDTQLWKTILDTNVLGLSIATREGIKQMKENKIDGHVIHLNSAFGHYVPSTPGLNVYPASKYAVTALAETLRHEINSQNLKIKVTSISPGYVATEFVAVCTGKTAQEIGVTTPGLQAKDVADAVVYALSTHPHVNVSELTVREVGALF
ncbi:farnesol dehydrogenase-like [Cylas formicarius]|uniref:farnesol dehydrogenase-like n=1 Tax=Cylas formicarius TaxID=197179 RepID=UPI002958D3A7|nr:farnesol dehydrogenase-like [Cylas formicarius]